jgi:hypothetical protein
MVFRKILTVPNEAIINAEDKERRQRDKKRARSCSLKRPRYRMTNCKSGATLKWSNNRGADMPIVLIVLISGFVGALVGAVLAVTAILSTADRTHYHDDLVTSDDRLLSRRSRNK